jgi:hypothetical protein
MVRFIIGLDFPNLQNDMNKKLYPWLILFLCASGASVLLQSIIYSLIGSQLFKLDSFKIWNLTTTSMDMIGSILLLNFITGRYHPLIFWKFDRSQTCVA